MNTTFPHRTLHSRSGFSLVEMLSVIAIIGVIAALAIPMISNVNSSARTSVARRCAQIVSSTFTAAKSSGVTKWDSSSAPADIIYDLGVGVTPENGPFAGKLFVIPGLPAASTPEFDEMMHYLDWDTVNLQLNYNGRF